MRFSFAKLRWSAAPLGLALAACGGETPVEPPPPIPVAMAAVSGDGQEGKTDQTLSEPFAVRVTDAQGDGVAGVEVAWTVTSGAGDLLSCSNVAGCAVVPSTDTGLDGIARVLFKPTALGTSTVAAEVAGLQGSSVAFTTDVTVLVIRLRGECLGEIGLGGFAGPDGSSDSAVPVGTTVEWVTHRCEARIVSSSAPPGGEGFDSGTFGLGGRFQFVPGVAGTWEYADEVSGATGTLTAR